MNLTENQYFGLMKKWASVFSNHVGSINHVCYSHYDDCLLNYIEFSLHRIEQSYIITITVSPYLNRLYQVLGEPQILCINANCDSSGPWPAFIFNLFKFSVVWIILQYRPFAFFFMLALFGQENGHSSMYSWILSTGWWKNRAPNNPEAVFVVGLLYSLLVGGFIYIYR